MLAAFACVFWLELPDAMAPLVFAIPFFALSVFSRTGIHIVDFASIIGLFGIGLAIGAIIKSESARLFLWTRVVLAFSVVLFVIASRPWSDAALGSVPFAVIAIWPPKKKGSNQLPEQADERHIET